MPLTAKGAKILAEMQEQYGDEKGKRVFYAAKNAGTIKGVDAWSEEARKAALAARRRKPGEGNPHSHGTAAYWAHEQTASRADMDRITREAGVDPEKLGPQGEVNFGNKQYLARASGGTKMVRRRKTDARRKGTARDPRGRVLQTWEEEDSMGSLFAMLDSTPSLMFDAVEMDDDAKLSFTAEGYLKAQPRIARTGIQLYRGVECGRDGVDTVRVYRPEATVFANDAIHSYTHLPITIEHPKTVVDSSNWKKHAVGETGDEVLRDGGSVRVPMMLRDSEAIRLVKDGKRELSVGYACDLEWGDGVTPDGEPYDAIQKNVRGNHLAIVAHARGGSTLRIGDTMSELKTVLIDGLPCQMTEKDAAIVQRTISKLEDQLEDQAENFKKKKAEDDENKKKCNSLEEGVKTKDALILTLQQQLKDATDPTKLDAQLVDRDAVRGKAIALMGNGFKIDGKSIEDVRREVVVAKSGVPTAKDWGDAEVKAVFDHLTAGKSTFSNPIRDASTAFSGTGFKHGATNAKDEAYLEMVRDMESAWKPKATA